jgi:hypothetical protein
VNKKHGSIIEPCFLLPEKEKPRGHADASTCRNQSTDQASPSITITTPATTASPSPSNNQASSLTTINTHQPPHHHSLPLTTIHHITTTASPSPSNNQASSLTTTSRINHHHNATSTSIHNHASPPSITITQRAEHHAECSQPPPPTLVMPLSHCIAMHLMSSIPRTPSDQFSICICIAYTAFNAFNATHTTHHHHRYADSPNYFMTFNSHRCVWHMRSSLLLTLAGLLTYIAVLFSLLIFFCYHFCGLILFLFLSFSSVFIFIFFRLCFCFLFYPFFLFC